MTEISNMKDLWDLVLEKIYKRISKPSYETWIEPLSGKILEGEILVIVAQNDFSRD